MYVYIYIYLSVCVCSGCITMHHFWWNFPEVTVQQRSKTPLRSATPQAPAALCSGPLFWQVQDLRRCLRSTTTRKIATAQQYTYESIQICICIYMYRIYTCVYIYACVIFLRIYIYLYVWYKCTGQTYMHDTDTITMCVHICSVCNRYMICRQNPNILVHVYIYICRYIICIYIHIHILHRYIYHDIHASLVFMIYLY